MSRYLFSGLLVALAVTAISAWARPPIEVALHLPDTTFRYANVKLPAHFTRIERNDDNTPPDNPLTDDGATLGRVLFYDTRLSANGKTSCASCHLQAHAFSDPRPASKGFRGAITDRRAMPLVNLRYYQRARFFWDERAGNLEEMVLQPIQSRVEMGQDLKTLVELFARDPTYPGCSSARSATPRSLRLVHQRRSSVTSSARRRRTSLQRALPRGKCRVLTGRRGTRPKISAFAARPTP